MPHISEFIPQIYNLIEANKKRRGNENDVVEYNIQAVLA
jgi:hypothetical protein